LRRQLPSSPLDHLGLPLLHQFVADLLGNPRDLAATDVDAGQAESPGGVGVGTHPAGRLGDLLQDGRAEVMIIQPQGSP
jgi:hypothetical protein